MLEYVDYLIIGLMLFALLLILYFLWSKTLEKPMFILPSEGERTYYFETDFVIWRVKSSSMLRAEHILWVQRGVCNINKKWRN